MTTRSTPRHAAAFVLGALAWLLSAMPGVAQSTINPSQPAQGSALTSAPVRANFQAAYNDINALYGLIGGGGGSLFNSPNTWTNVNTYTPATGVPGIIVNGAANTTGENAGAIRVNKGANADSGVDILAPDNSGKGVFRIYGPTDVMTGNPSQYWTTGGAYTRLFLLVSGISTGSGESYNISFPSPDAFMIGCWADVAKCVQTRCAFGFTGGVAGGGANMSYLEQFGHYVGGVLCDGTLAFGSPTNTTFAGMDAQIGYGGTNKINIGGPDSSAPGAQRLGPSNVAAPTTNGGGYSFGKTFHFAAGVPGGVAPGQVVHVISPPSDTASCQLATLVVSVDVPGSNVTVDNFCNPYQGDTFQFNGGAGPTAVMTNQVNSNHIGFPAVPAGVVATVTTIADVSNPTAIPANTTVTSTDGVSLPGTLFLILSNNIDGVLFNTAPGGLDTLQFSNVNVAAADMTYACGIGTGTGVGGVCHLAASPAGSTGSAQNSLVDYATINPAPSTGRPEFEVLKGLRAGFYSTAPPNTQTGASYSVGATDTDIIANGSGTLTLTLPTAANFIGRVIRVKTIVNQTVVSNASNVAPLTSATPGTAILAGTAGKWADIKSDGTNWVAMAGN